MDNCAFTVDCQPWQQVVNVEPTHTYTQISVEYLWLFPWNSFSIAFFLEKYNNFAKTYSLIISSISKAFHDKAAKHNYSVYSYKQVVKYYSSHEMPWIKEILLKYNTHIRMPMYNLYVRSRICIRTYIRILCVYTICM